MPDFAERGGILVPRKYSPKQYSREIATARNNLIYPLYGSNRVISRDWTVRTKTTQFGESSYAIYDDVLRDPHAYAVMQKRYMEVIGREWQVHPGSERRRDKKAAEMVERQLKGLGLNQKGDDKIAIAPGMGFDSTMLGMMSAILKGFSVGEVLWARTENEVYAKEIRVKDQRRFAFIYLDEHNAFGLRLLTNSSAYEGMELPARKFIIHSFHSEYDSPLGYGLGEKLYWPVWFKKNGIRFWLAFADKFGSPTTVGKIPVGLGPDEETKYRDTLLSAIDSIAQETGVVIPEDTAIEFLEATRTSTTDTYESMANYMDNEMSKAVLGETGSTDQSEGGGSRARDEVGERVRVSIAKFDADLLAETLNRTLVRWIVDFNFPRGSVEYPRIEWQFPELEEKENLNDRVSRDKSLLELGYRLTAEKQEQVYGDGYVPATGDDEQEQPPLVATLGVGGTTSLMQFLQQSATQMPRENAIAVLMEVFGISEEAAGSMIPEQEEEGGSDGPSNEDELARIFEGAPEGGGDEPQPIDGQDLEGAPNVELSEGREMVFPPGGKVRMPRESLDFIAARAKTKNCNKARSFPCGRSCQPHKTRSGKETQCRNRLVGQAKTAQEWLKSMMSPDESGGLAYPSGAKLAKWLQRHQGAKILLDSFADGSVINTGAYIGEGVISRINPPSKKFLHGSVSVKSVEGMGSDKFDFVLLADRILKQQANFSEPKPDRPQDIATLYAEQATEAVSQSINAWRDRINDVVQSINDGPGDDAQKFRALEEQLYVLYSEIEPDDYAEVLGEAIAAAQLAGRYEVVEEVGSDDIDFSEGKYSHINFVPPEGVQKAAERGLELRKKHKRGGLSNKQASKEGIGSGVQRATNLKNGDRVSPKTISQMVSFFARHEKNKDSKADDGSPGAGRIAWLLWGGDAGKAWANKVKGQIDAVDMTEPSNWVEALQVLSFAEKPRNCNPKKSFPCGRSCQTLRPNKDGSPRKCSKALEGEAKDASEWLKTQAQKADQPEDIEVGLAPINQDPLGTPPKDELFAVKSFAGVGHLKQTPPENVELEDIAPDDAMVEAFSRGEQNLTHALIYEAGIADDGSSILRPADMVSAQIIASAREAGAEEVTTTVVREQDQELAAELMGSNESPLFGKTGERSSLSAVGTLMYISSDEISGGEPSISQEQVDIAAQKIRDGAGTNLQPVLVIETGPEQFEVIGNANQLAIARRAGVEPRTYIVDRTG